jgi:transposase
MTYREKVGMGGHLLMSEKERLCMAILQMVSRGQITLIQAAEQCKLSYRQIKRVYRRYKAEGDAGLVHQARGQKSNRKHPHREMIIARYKEKYKGFGPTLAAEKLMEEDGLIVNHETLREWLLKDNLWHKQRKRSPHRRQRECRAQFGELVQIDGSIHDWFSEGRHRCLLNMVDDATSKTYAHMESGETTRCVFQAIWEWVERYGVPLAFYVDLKTVYVSPKDITFSHVEKTCKKLGICIIKAYSPQAKGRVERSHGVYQDRFVKELQLKNIKTIEKANALLKNGFIDKLNHKFEKPARNRISAHRPLNDLDLNQILCWEYERKVKNDWTFSFMSECFQITKTSGHIVRPNKKIIVRRHLDGSTSAWYENQQLCIKQLARRPEVLAQQKLDVIPLSASAAGRRHSRTSPWRKFNPTWFKKTGTY